MAKIIYGYLSLFTGIIALLITLAELLVLFVLPPATYIFERIFYMSFTPLIIALVGLFFYYLQWRLFTTKIVNTALIINSIVLLFNIYLLYELYLAI